MSRVYLTNYFTIKSNIMKHFRIYFFAALSLLLMYSCQDDETTDNSLQATDTSLSDLVRTCSTHEKMEEWLRDPEFSARHKAKFTRLSQSSALARSTCSDPPVIPVAVHFQGVSGADASCLINLAKSQIDILNADFGGTNGDITKWTNGASSSFPGLANGEACLKFCLADQDHPSGYSLVEGNPAVTINQTTGDSNNDFTGYLNIFVQFGTGVLGYSPLGGSGNGDGVVIEGTAFGTGNGCGNIVPEAPYNLGRTATHEVGHYLLLDHIWGGGCGQDDDVADTPDSNDPYYDCPSVGVSTCGSTDLHMNYMDYTNDACMYMFSAGQVDRSENYVATSLAVLTANASVKCSDAGSGSGGGGTGEEEEEDEEDDEDDEEDEEEEDENEDDEDDNNDDPVDSNCKADAVDYYTGAALTNQECYEAVIAEDQYCCKVEFDWICMDLYEECLEDIDGGNGDEEDEENDCVESVDVYSGEELEGECVSIVQEYDTYCCDIEWDAICQDFYDQCSEYGYGDITDSNTDNAIISIGKNSESGQVLLSYSIREWKADTVVEIYNGNEKVKAYPAQKRRGTIRVNLATAKTTNLKANIRSANKVLARTEAK